MFKFWKEIIKADKEEREREAKAEEKAQSNPEPVSLPPLPLKQPSKTEFENDSCSQDYIVSETGSIDWANPDSIDKIALGITKVPGYVRPEFKSLNSDSEGFTMPDPYQLWCYGNWEKERRGLNTRKRGRSDKEE